MRADATGSAVGPADDRLALALNESTAQSRSLERLTLWRAEVELRLVPLVLSVYLARPANARLVRHPHDEVALG